MAKGRETAEAGEEKIVASNRRAYFEYFVIDKYEAGIALKGTEVKSLRKSDANMQDSYALIRNGEVWLIGLHISPFEKGNINNHNPTRERRLLMHKREILRLHQKTGEQGLTLVPLNIYFKGNHVKVTLAVVKGKKLHDKRETIQARDVEREMRRKLRT